MGKIPPHQQLLNIFQSTSRCIYQNLAFEEWLFRNHDVTKKGDALIIWRNTPTVVIGRYQNPWIETNICYCQENDIRLARRHSGGGAVYHDLGNVNVSILTTHERHSRKRNLQMLANQLNEDLHLLSTSYIATNSRDDLTIEPAGTKISGTAARISHGKAYHHFTLLVDADLEKLRYSLHSPLKDKIETTATRSVRAKLVGNIVQKMESDYPSVEPLIAIVGRSITKCFSSQYMEHRAQQWDSTAGEYAGVNELLAQLKSDEWIYGKTPKFSLKLLDGHNEELRSILVENGRIKKSTNSEFPIGRPFSERLLVSRYSELSL